MSALMYRRWVLAGVAFAAVLAVAAVWWCLRGGAPDHRPYPPPLGFDGPSDRLKQTVVVPTLSTPVPEGRSAIWCASFQLAWNRLRDDVARGPVRLSNGQPVADLLNGAGSKETDLPADAVYAAAGLVRDGVVGHIQREMARRFPDVARPAFDVPPEGAVAYAYLAASARFDLPYFENDRPLLFTDAAGKKTPVGSFGIRKKEEYAHYRLRD